MADSKFGQSLDIEICNQKQTYFSIIVTNKYFINKVNKVFQIPMHNKQINFFNARSNCVIHQIIFLKINAMISKTFYYNK